MDRERRPLYVLPGSNPGLLIKGNIDINNRPSVKNPRGGTSSVYSASFQTEVDGHLVEVLVPRVVGGRIVTARQGFLHFLKTGKHLGIFDTPMHATMYARRLHNQQAGLVLR